MKSRKIFMKQLMALLVVLSSLTACNNNSSIKPTTTATANTPDTVPVFILHDTAVAKNIELPAELLPYEQSQLFARVQGYVKDIKVDIGDRVHRGQTLAIIEAPELNAKQAEYQSSIEAAKANGTWEKAYDAQSKMTIPEDFLKALQKNKKANAFFKTLNRTNLFSIAFRLQTAKKEETRQKRIEKIIDMLEREEKFH